MWHSILVFISVFSHMEYKEYIHKFSSYNAIVACEYGPRQAELISSSFALQISVLQVYSIVNLLGVCPEHNKI